VNGNRLALAIISATLLTLAFVGCGEEADQRPNDNPDSSGEWTIEDARAFDGFDLYWLGESYQDLPLTDIIRYRYEGGASTENLVLFTYGSCDPPSGLFDEGGCALPISIRIEPYCDKPPELFAALPGSIEEIRGAEAKGLDDTDSSRVHLWTSDVSVDTTSTQYDTAQVVEALRPISEDASDQLAPLPSPQSEPCSSPLPTPDFNQ
jgi:hypothetical protein